MKKIWGSAALAVSLLVSGQVHAAQEQQLKTLQEMYSLGKRLEKGNEIIEMYADQSLTRAFYHEASSDEYCIGGDIMWQSNDPPFERKVTYTKLGNNKIKANLHAFKPNYEATWVIYQFNCSSGQCKVSDVFDSEGSFKRALNSC